MMCLSQQKQEQIFAMEKKGQELVCKTSFEQKKLDIYEAQGKRGRVQDDSFYFESMSKVHVGNHASMGEEKISGSSKLKIKSSREELALQAEKIRQPESLGGVRESYGEVIFNHQRVKLNSSQKVLLQIQLFLDDKLHFLKFQREKSKGQSFQILRRSFLEDRIFLEMKQLRQMLFIMPDLYICNWRKDQANKDQLIISLPESLDLQSRKKEFLQKLITYLFTQKQDPSRVQVPQSSLFYEPSTGDSPSTEKKKNHAKYDIWKNLETTRKINLRNALQSPNFFEEVLLRRVREREEQLRKKEEQQKQIKYGTPQMLRIFDETYKLYQKKKVSSMLKKTLMKELQIILSKTRNQVIELVLEELIKGSSDYFKVNSSHAQGLLIEVKKSLYNETRKKIIQCQKQN